MTARERFATKVSYCCPDSVCFDIAAHALLTEQALPTPSSKKMYRPSNHCALFVFEVGQPFDCNPQFLLLHKPILQRCCVICATAPVSNYSHSFSSSRFFYSTATYPSPTIMEPSRSSRSRGKQIVLHRFHDGSVQVSKLSFTRFGILCLCHGG